MVWLFHGLKIEEVEFLNLIIVYLNQFILIKNKLPIFYIIQKYCNWKNVTNKKNLH